MNTTSLQRLEAPRIVRGKELLLAGLSQHFDCENSASGIPALWQRFGPHIGNIPGQLGRVAYGVVSNTDDAGNMDYLCAVEVSDVSRLPSDFTQLRLPPRQYAVFLHREHVSSIRSTWNAIWNDRFPESKHKVADAPFFERYDESFNALTGNGGVELWVPISE